MPLPDAAVAWLRAFDPVQPGDPVVAACALQLLRRRTPAWTERYDQLLAALPHAEDDLCAIDALAARIAGAPAPLRELVDQLVGAAPLDAALSKPVPAGPMIVGVDHDRLVLTRAEWASDCLLLTLAPHSPDPAARTEFRLVGAELRVWCQTGIDGAVTDTTSQGVVIRTPLVAGDLEFAPGSY